MNASILDLQYRMKDILRALDRGQSVKILYHGKLKGTLIPPQTISSKNIQDHPFFGMLQNEKESVEVQINKLRRNC